MSVTSLACHRFACSLAQPLCDPIFLLHGWGGNSNLWAPLIPELQKITNVIAIDLPGFGDSPKINNFSLETILDLIAEQIMAPAVLIGWSLGGMLAVQLASRYPQKISRIVTLASNVKFVDGDGYDAAMDSTVNHQFNKSFETAPEETLKLFGGLMAQGDANDRVMLKKMRIMAGHQKITSNWLQALELLSALDNRMAFAMLTQPGLHLLGEADVLVPVAAAKQLAQLNSQQSIKILPATSHALHWSKPTEVAELISSFLIPLDKKRIAQSFSKAARTYDAVAGLQREVGEKLFHYVNVSTSKNVIVDLGCGTGYFTEKLQSVFPQSQLIGLDLAEGMVSFAQSKNQSGCKWLCADAEQLPLANNSVDVIFSSLALQWCSDLKNLFSEIVRVLKPGGQLLFTTLGPQTLNELKSAWQQVDQYVHVNRFRHRDDVQSALVETGFSIVNFEQSPSVVQFEKLTDLTRSLKALGAHNVNRGQAPGLQGRKKIEAFKNAYEAFRQDDNLPATYDVFYITAYKTAEKSE